MGGKSDNNKQKKRRQQEASPTKTKLRTASEVINRLKWSYGSDEGDVDADQQSTAQNAMVGYDCRINGPMEKCAANLTGINEGGDIPEHRIQHFRLKTAQLVEKGILWDRHGRVDRLFGSGAGANEPISQTRFVRFKL